MKLFRIAVKAGLSTSLLSVLLACSGGSNDDDVFQLPLVGIDFPPVQSATNGSSINIHALAVGVSSNVQSVSLQVNGNTELTVPAQSDFFQYLLPIASLTEENNLVGVTAVDANLSQNDSVSIARGSSWMFERGLQFDPTGSRWLAVDAARQALLQLDLDTDPNPGVKTVLAGGVAGVGLGVDLVIPEDMVIDSVGNRALVVDSELQAIVAIPLVAVGFEATAERSIISSATVPDANNVFAKPVAIEINAAADTAYVLDAENMAIIAVNLASGTRTITADNTSPGTPKFIRPIDIVLQESAGRLLVSDAGVSGILAIDIASGTRSIVSDAQTPNSDNTFQSIKNLAIAGDVLYVSDSGTNAITEVELRPDNIATPEIVFGARTVLSDAVDSSGANIPDTTNPLRFPAALAVDSTNNHLLVIDNVFGVLAQVDLVDDADGSGTGTLKGERTYVVDGATTAATDSAVATTTARAAVFNFIFDMDSPQGLSSSDNGRVLYVVDVDINSVIAFDPLTNSGTFITDVTTTTLLDSSGGIAFTASGLLSAVDQTLLAGAVEGSYTAVSTTNTGAGNGAEFTIAINASNEISSLTVTTAGVDYVYDDQLTIAGADLGGSGSVTITLTDSFVRMVQPKTLVTDITSTGSVAGFYIVDAALGQVLQMTVGGSLSVVSDSDVAPPLLDPLASVLLDEILYVLDAELGEIVAVDLTDGAEGARTVLTTDNIGDSPTAMVLDATGENLLVATASSPTPGPVVHSIYEVAIADGVATEVAADIGLADTHIVDMLLDTAEDGATDDRLLMLDRGRSAVFPVDLTTGMAGPDITSPAVPAPPGGADPANVFVAPQGMVLNNNVAALFVFDEVLRSVYMVDLRPRDETDDDVDNPEIDPQRVMIVRGTALNK